MHYTTLPYTNTNTNTSTNYKYKYNYKYTTLQYTTLINYIALRYPRLD